MDNIHLDSWYRGDGSLMLTYNGLDYSADDRGQAEDLRDKLVNNNITATYTSMNDVLGDESICCFNPVLPLLEENIQLDKDLHRNQILLTDQL